MVVKLPAKSVSAAITHLIDVYRRDRLSGEGLPAYIDRVGKVKLKDELIPYTIVPSFQDDSTFYYDWEGEEEFILEDLGPGECAGGALDAGHACRGWSAGGGWAGYSPAADDPR